jgi:hypothetical protein
MIKGHPERLKFRFVPPSPYPQDKPPVTHFVHGAGHFRHEGGVPELITEY